MTTREHRVERSAEPDRLVTAVVEAISAAIGTDMAQTEARLYDVVDPDGLEQVFRKKANGSRRLGGELRFSLLECEVIVHSEGRVTVNSPVPSCDALYTRHRTSTN